MWYCELNRRSLEEQLVLFQTNEQPLQPPLLSLYPRYLSLGCVSFKKTILTHTTKDFHAQVMKLSWTDRTLASLLPCSSVFHKLFFLNTIKQKAKVKVGLLRH